MPLSEATLLAMFGGAPFGVAIYDVSAEYVCVRHNQSFLGLVGQEYRRRGSIVGVSLRELFDDRSYDAVRGIFDRVRDTGERFVVDEFPAVLLPDPEPRYYEWSLTPSLDGERVAWLVCVAVEVTDLVCARQRAERDNKHLRFLADAGAVLASARDVDATLNQAARHAVEWFADLCTIDVVSPEGSLRRVALAHRDPRLQDEMRAIADQYPTGWEKGHPVGTVLASGESLVANDLPASVADAIGSGDPSFALSRASTPRAYLICPLVARGHKIGVIGFVVTDRPTAAAYSKGDLALGEEFARRVALAIDNAQLHAEAEAARVSAEAANRAKDEFLALLGHELRNPLAPIRTAVDLMNLRGGATQNERNVIERQVSHLSRLIDDLLDVSRIARGKIELTQRPVELAALVADALEQASPLMERRNHHLVLEVAPRGLTVNGDGFRLAQVIANLLTNAAKYTPAGGHISVHGAREGDSVVLRVRDDGAGVRPELLPVVFDMFVQGQRTIEHASGGLGLGLALVKNLVTLHGGSVEARSEGSDRGSEFTVRLPAYDVSDDAAPENAIREPVSHRQGFGAPRRILVVDDNADALDLLAEALRRRGHEVVVAEDGPAALRVLESFDLEVGIFDIGLPVMDGFELAVQVLKRASSAARRPRLIAASGYGQPHDRAKSRDAGFDVHFVKPVDLDALLRAIAAP